MPTLEEKNKAILDRADARIAAKAMMGETEIPRITSQELGQTNVSPGADAGVMPPSVGIVPAPPPRKPGFNNQPEIPRTQARAETPKWYERHNNLQEPGSARITAEEREPGGAYFRSEQKLPWADRGQPDPPRTSISPAEFGTAVKHGGVEGVEEFMQLFSDQRMPPPTTYPPLAGQGAEAQKAIEAFQLEALQTGAPTDQRILPEVAEPATSAGKGISGLTQFAVGFAPGIGIAKTLQVGPKVAAALGNKFPKLAKWTGTVAEGEVAAGLAEQTVFDPADPVFSNFINEIGMGNALTEFLATNEDDPQALNRFKRGLEGLGLGLLVSPVVDAVAAMGRGLKGMGDVSAELAVEAGETVARTIPAVARTIPVAWEAITKNWEDATPIPGINSNAIRRMAQRAYDDGITADEWEQTLRMMGEDATLVDAGGRNTLNQLKALIHEPGKTAQLAETVLTPRTARTTSRMVGSIKENISSEDFHTRIDSLNAEQARKASPLYEEAYNDPNNANLETKWLDVALENEDKDILKGLRQGYNRMRRDATRAGKVFVPPFEYRMTKKGKMIITSNARPIQMWHAARIGLDVMIEKGRGDLGNLSSDAKSLAGLRADLDREIKAATGGPDGAFSRADKIYSGPAKLKDAMRRGRKFASGDEELLVKNFQKMSVDEQEAFRVGVARELIAKMRATRQTPSIMKDIAYDTSISDKIRAVSPTQEAFESLQSRINTEIEFSKTSAARGGSQTQSLREEGKDMGYDFAGAAAAAATEAVVTGGPPVAPVARSVLSWIRRPRPGITQEERDLMGEYYLSGDPEKQKLVLDAIRKIEAQRPPPRLQQ